MQKPRLPSFRGRDVAFFSGACLLAAVGLVSCGGGGGSSGETPAPPISAPPPLAVSINPLSPLLPVAQSQQFTATVQNDPQKSGVTWSVSGCSGGCGTLTPVSSTSVTYVAPASGPATNVLTATSVSDNTKSASTVIPITMGPASIFTDAFDRANVNPIATPWSNYAYPMGGAIVGQQLTGSNTGDYFISLSAPQPPPDQYAKIRFAATANSGTGVDNGGPMVRMDGDGNGWLFNWISNSPTGNSTWQLFRVDKGVGQQNTVISGVFPQALVDGDVVEIRAIGNVIIGYLNGIAVPGAITTDPTYPTGGFGVHLFSNTGRWDDFEGGSL